MAKNRAEEIGDQFSCSVCGSVYELVLGRIAAKEEARCFSCGMVTIAWPVEFKLKLVKYHERKARVRSYTFRDLSL